MGPELIWENVTMGISVVFEKILALKQIRHIVNSKRVIEHTKM